MQDSQTSFYLLVQPTNVEAISTVSLCSSTVLEIAEILVVLLDSFSRRASHLLTAHIVLERRGQSRNDGRNEAPEVNLDFCDGAYADADEHNQDAQLGAAAEKRFVQDRLERARCWDDGELGNLSLQKQQKLIRPVKKLEKRARCGGPDR